MQGLLLRTGNEGGQGRGRPKRGNMNWVRIVGAPPMHFTDVDIRVLAPGEGAGKSQLTFLKNVPWLSNSRWGQRANNITAECGQAWGNSKACLHRNRVKICPKFLLPHFQNWTAWELPSDCSPKRLCVGYGLGITSFNSKQQTLRQEQRVSIYKRGDWGTGRWRVFTSILTFLLKPRDRGSFQQSP